MPDLTGVSETMLLALHNRVGEAKRADGVLADPEGLRIYESINYDFGRHFGNSEGALAVRAAEIDRVLRQWLVQHPDGFVVSLGEGLETQARRVDNGRVRWLSVDFPDAIRLRECFIPPTDRFRHLAASALDRAWMDAVEPSSGLFIVAQGLFMYLDPEAVRRVFIDIAERFPDADMVFDVVPRWFSHLTLWGLRRTPHYRFPPMPWGINHDEIEPTLRRWHPRFASIELLPYQMPRGAMHDVDLFLRPNPLYRNVVPNLVHIRSQKGGNHAPTRPEQHGSVRSARQQSGSLSAHGSTLAAENVRQVSLPALPHWTLSPDRAPGGNSLLKDYPMFIGSTAVARAMQAVLAFAEMSTKTGEMATAANTVIGERVALMAQATRDPLAGDYAEFARMLPEKLSATHQACAALLDGWWALQRDARDYMIYIARTMTNGRPPSPSDVAELAERTSFHGTQIAASAIDAATVVLAPFHECATSNAQRLSRRKRQWSRVSSV